MKMLGFSTGALYRAIDPISAEALEHYWALGIEAVEICFNKAEQIEKAEAIVQAAKQFSHVSLHAPCNIRYRNDTATREVLAAVADFYKAVLARAVVVHPDLVDDWAVFDDANIVWAVENMDTRKPAFRLVADLEKFFAEHDKWKLTLDLAHCLMNDQSMALAQEFIDAFGDRIVEMHISGTDGSLHAPLFRTKETAVLDCAKKVDAPAIVESAFAALGEAQDELNFIMKYLARARSPEP